MNAALAVLANPRGLALAPERIAGIARSSTSAVRDWLDGAAPPEGASLRLHVAARVLERLDLGISRTAFHCPPDPAGPLTFADLIARHCRS